MIDRIPAVEVAAENESRRARYLPFSDGGLKVGLIGNTSKIVSDLQEYLKEITFEWGRN